MSGWKQAGAVLRGTVLGAAALVTAGAAAADDQIRVRISVDNSYALFVGDVNGATTFVGTDGNWPTVETYDFTLSKDSFLYVVTASDQAVAQGFLGQFENLSSGYKFYSNDIQWQVMATGLGSTGAPYTGSAANLALLSKEIQDANAGGNFTQGWTGLTAGPANGAAPWGALAGIDAAARWVWFSSNGDADPTSPGFNHQEWLVFRIGVAATPDGPATGVVTSVPEPGTWGLMALGLLGVGVAARRRRAA